MQKQHLSLLSTIQYLYGFKVKFWFFFLLIIWTFQIKWHDDGDSLPQRYEWLFVSLIWHKGRWIQNFSQIQVTLIEPEIENKVYEIFKHLTSVVFFTLSLSGFSAIQLWFIRRTSVWYNEDISRNKQAYIAINRR